MSSPTENDVADSPLPPVLFLGHGSPLNAIEDNRWSRGFRAIGEQLERPRAVLSISAHWWTSGTLLTAGARPKTIHDFGHFPRELFEVRYPAAGSPDLARRVVALLEGERPESRPGAQLSEAWGLDHGTWSVLKHVFPEANVPVVQLSLDQHKSPAEHARLGRSLSELRTEGVLILGSGNLTHNLPDAAQRRSSGVDEPPDWARAFDNEVSAMIEQRDGQRLARTWPDGEHARRAHPHPDHWLPLLYAQAAADESDAITYPIDGFDWGSLSMRSVRWG